MRVVCNQQLHMTEVWCTRDERTAAGFWDIVRSQTGNGSGQKYKTVVYVSGSGDLLSLTSALLVQNK